MKHNEFWRKHWLEHFVILALIFFIGLTLLFCRKCYFEDFSGSLDRIVAPHEPQQPTMPTTPRVPDERSIPDRRIENGGDCGKFCVSLIWESKDDLDLIVRQPNGTTISVFRNGTTHDRSTEGKLDVDKNVEGTALTNKPIENVTWDNPLMGNYVIRVKLYKQNSTATSIPFKLSFEDDLGRTMTQSGRVSRGVTERTFNISYPF